jgi:hypothetical protein
MLKSGLLRQLRLCRGPSFPAAFANTARIAIQPASHLARTKSRLAVSRGFSEFRRGFASASHATAAIDDAPVQDVNDGPITRFSQLEQLGVHSRLQSAITAPKPSGFGFEEMTEVQQKTINAALAGRDMYESTRLYFLEQND